MFLNKCFDGLLELFDRVMIASLNLLLSELGKPALDLIDPGTVGWCKVQVVAGPFCQPATHERRLVCGVVIEDDMDLLVFRHSCIDLVQKVAAIPQSGVGDSTWLAHCQWPPPEPRRARPCHGACNHECASQLVPGAWAIEVGCVEEPESDPSRRRRAPRR